MSPLKARLFLLLVILISLACPMIGADAFTGVYHEASCPSVDRTRMIRMKRAYAESIGLLPALDCHPDARVRYLGISGASGYTDSNSSTGKSVQVRSYTRADGTRVEGYTRAAPHGD